MFENKEIAAKLADIHDTYIVPADKASNNVCFVCKKYFIQCLNRKYFLTTNQFFHHMVYRPQIRIMIFRYYIGSSRKLQTIFRKFYGRHTDLVHKCDTSVSHMLNGLFTNCDICMVVISRNLLSPPPRIRARLRVRNRARIRVKLCEKAKMRNCICREKLRAKPRDRP